MMTRTAEARFWQGMGAAIGIAGGFVMAYNMGRYGLASIEPVALLYGMAASFLMLAGGACYVAGRALHVEETALTSREASLWKTLSTVCLVAGGLVVISAWRQNGDLLRDRMAMGMAGAFSMMFGVICLVGVRVMSRMHDALVLPRSEEKSRVASIGDR